MGIGMTPERSKELNQRPHPQTTINSGGKRTVESIDEMSNEVLLCRINHMFDYQYDYEVEVNVDQEVVEFKKLFICLRCRMKKIETVDASDFQIKKRDYDDVPEGYYLKPGSGRVTKSDVRKTQFKREHTNTAINGSEKNDDDNRDDDPSDRTEHDQSRSSVQAEDVAPGGEDARDEGAPSVSELPPDDRMDSEDDGDEEWHPHVVAEVSVRRGGGHRRTVVREDGEEAFRDQEAGQPGDEGSGTYAL